jgi:hypothetical protein
MWDSGLHDTKHNSIQHNDINMTLGIITLDALNYAGIAILSITIRKCDAQHRDH